MLAVLPIAGCGPLALGNDGDNPAADSGAGGSSTTGTSCDYDTLESKLSARTSPFLGTNVESLTPVGTRLFWYDTTSYAPVLDGDTDGNKPILAYKFSVGDSLDDANYIASDNLIVTAQPSDSGVTYYAYDPGQANHLIGSTNTSAPDDASYWAYAVDGANVYLVETDENGDNALIEWVPSSGSSTKKLTTLESAGAQVGEFEAFGVSGNTMVFVASGALWTLDLEANKATSLGNKTEVSPVGAIDFESDGVMFAVDADSADDQGLMFFEYSSNKLVDVSSEINASASPCATGMGASNYSTDFARWGSKVVYIGQGDGVFAFDMTTHVITPVLLPPANSDVTIQYRYPIVLSDGKLFVTALTSRRRVHGCGRPYRGSRPSQASSRGASLLPRWRVRRLRGRRRRSSSSRGRGGFGVCLYA